LAGLRLLYVVSLFIFQAEDGIRVFHVTGVQTCALPILDLVPLRDRDILRMVPVGKIAAIRAEGAYTRILISGQPPMMVLYSIGEIGRASCRDRVWSAAASVSLGEDHALRTWRPSDQHSG